MKGPQTLKEALKEKLTKDEMGMLVSSFDRIGDMIIIEVPEELEHKEKLIGQTLLSMHKNVKVVAKKIGIHYGKYRRQRLKILAGERRKTALYVENGIRMYVNYEAAYFSVRLGSDRLRVARLVKPGEDVLVMFSGVGPYCLNIRKHSDAGAIYGVEMNPKGHALALKNVALNKMKNIYLYCGNVRDVVPKLRKKFDRVLMPLPKSANEFLDVAIDALKPKGTVHYYAFWHQDEWEKERKQLREWCKKLGYRIRIKNIIKCGVHKPRVHRMCVEFSVI